MIEQVTLDLLQVAMDINQTQHKAAAANIAAANIPDGNKTTVNFDQLLSSLHGAEPAEQAAILDDIKQNWASKQSDATTISQGEKIKLDQQTADLLLSSGKYKVLAEGLNRKLGLMQVAVNGGKR